MSQSTESTPADLRHSPRETNSGDAGFIPHAIARWLSQSPALDPWSPQRVAAADHNPGVFLQASRVVALPQETTGCEAWSSRATEGSTRC